MDASPEVLAALEAIRKAVEEAPGGRRGPRVDPTKVLTDPAKAVERPGVAARVAGGAAAGGGAILGAITQTFGAVLPPLNLLANTLGAANSGLSLVTKTLGIMGAVLAPIILPFLFLFAAAVLYAAQAIQKELWPALEKIWKELGPALGDAFRSLIDITGRLVTGLGNFLRAIGAIDNKETPNDRLRDRNIAKTDADLKTEQKYPLRRPGEETDEMRAERVKALEAELAELNKRNLFRPGENTPDLSHPHEAYKKALRDRLEELKKPTPEPKDAQEFAERAKREAYRDTNPPIADKFQREDMRWRAGEKAGEEAWKKWHADRGQAVPELPPGLSRNGPPAAAPGKPGDKPGPAAAPGKPPNPAAAGLAGMTGIFDALLKSFEMSLGPPAAFGGIGAEQIQAGMLAALNQDPLEQIQQQFYRESLPMLRTIVDSLGGDKGTFKKGP